MKKLLFILPFLLLSTGCLFTRSQRGIERDGIYTEPITLRVVEIKPRIRADGKLRWDIILKDRDGTKYSIFMSVMDKNIKKGDVYTFLRPNK